MIRLLLWDLDGTILDFHVAEQNALLQTFAALRLGACTETMIADYSTLNERYWKRLERGELTKPQLVVQRFEEFLTAYSLDPTLASAVNQEYQWRLSETICYRDSAQSLLASLHTRYPQYIVTNGPLAVQRRKLKNAALLPYLDGVFLSDEIGAEKPSAVFFDYVFRHIGAYEKEEILIIGDSLTSDIQGGIQAGIRTCWYNPEHSSLPPEYRPDYSISNLQELPALLAAG